ncbi:FliI/YscN family ATPase [Phyllobacterium myrsinacearum]|uniref:Flagellum-specific ATP synthase FliI n=2 Tax=Phyllobacterium myrsinacearum TaxID=28101 RepID=A0A2S9JQB1_9HYPH|nr:flagellum-specific ATP synthase FliI [Phyllobacterium myrsinacearum]PWV91760.1 type III secretion system FliI/YscN family ATPase [Phyllobacterium myrsinacearum]RZV05829.1 type III secretion system FliI/YscN family ATPase [Phyllobacterium myrsinacearum]
MQSDLSRLMNRFQRAAVSAHPLQVHGRVRRITGVIIHASLPMVRIGELCEIRDPVSGRTVPAEVIGFDNDDAVLSPIGDMAGMSTRAEVIPTGSIIQVPVGPGLLGCVVNALGDIVNDNGRDPDAAAGIVALYPTLAEPVNALQRDLVRDPLQLGIRAIDGLLTVARGQRIGIFGAPGAGKSSLISSIVRGTQADVVVIALIGERGREVREFLDVQLGVEGRKRAVTVVATSDRPAIERVKAAHCATAIAEYFRDEGKDVLLLMDSVTRFARAQREIGLAAGEPGTRRAYPPSLFAALPRLLERSGPGVGGSITGLYTVLTEGDETLDPVAEEVKAILDGHVSLSSQLAEKNHFPAIDILRSRSRLMDAVANESHRASATAIREMMARYEEVELLLRVNEYKAGSDAVTDRAVERHQAITDFLRQESHEHSTFNETLDRMWELAN